MAPSALLSASASSVRATHAVRAAAAPLTHAGQIPVSPQAPLRRSREGRTGGITSTRSVAELLNAPSADESISTQHQQTRMMAQQQQHQLQSASLCTGPPEEDSRNPAAAAAAPHHHPLSASAKPFSIPAASFIHADTCDAIPSSGPSSSSSSDLTLHAAAPMPAPSPRNSSSSASVSSRHLPPTLAYSASCGGYAASSSTSFLHKDHNSVTIKSNTSVKDAAGAIVKVLERIPSALVTALRLEATHESLNRAVKSIAVARKYVIDRREAEKCQQQERMGLRMRASGAGAPAAATPALLAAAAAAAAAGTDPNLDCGGRREEQEGSGGGKEAVVVEVEEGLVDLSFLPVLRSNSEGVVDPSLFAFLCFKTRLSPGVRLLESDEVGEDLNVGRRSNVQATAGAMIRAVMAKGQAVVKAGGSEAIFIAMSALVAARSTLKRNYGWDVMAVPAWISQDTLSSLGRESKFLRFNVLPCPVHGPIHNPPCAPRDHQQPCKEEEERQQQQETRQRFQQLLAGATAAAAAVSSSLGGGGESSSSMQSVRPPALC